MKLLAFIVFAVIVTLCQGDCDVASCVTIDSMAQQFQDQCGLSQYSDDQSKGPRFYDDGRMCHETVDQDVKDVVRDIFPEGKKFSPDLVTDSISFVPKASGDAYVTFYKTGAGYQNKFSFYYNDENGDMKFIDIFPYINNFEHGCLNMGDTAKVPVEEGVTYGFVLFPNYWVDPKTPLYSNVHMGTGLEARDNVGHVVWVKTKDDGETGTAQVVFGFEDKDQGSDYDYNDILFTIQLPCGGNYGDIPIYDDGGLNKCFDVETVTSSSYAEFECSQYALLEKTEENSCTTYLTVPDGWEVAEDDDESKGAIANISKWHTYECIGVKSGNVFVGYKSDGNTTCTNFNEQVKTKAKEDDTEKTCYRTDCKYRILIKRIKEEGDNRCGKDYGYCEADSITYPSNNLGWIVFPNSYSNFYPSLDGSDEISITVRETEKVDIFVVVDLDGLKDGDINNIKSSLQDLYTRYDETDVVRIGIAGYSSSGGLKNGLLSQKLDEDAFDNTIKKQNSGGDTMSEAFILAASKCANCGWRDDSVRVVVIASHKNPLSVDSALTKQVLDNNHNVIFVGASKDKSAFQALASAFGVNFQSDTTNQSNDEKRYKNFLLNVDNDLLDHFLDKSYIHVVSGGDVVEPTPSTVVINVVTGVDNKHQLTVKNTGTAVVNTIGRSQTIVTISVNQAPVSSNGNIGITVPPVGENVVQALKIPTYDPDGGKFDISFNVDSSVVGVVGIYSSLTCSKQDAVACTSSSCACSNNYKDGKIENAFDNFEVYIVFSSDIEQGSLDIQYTSDDKCASTDGTITVTITCDESSSEKCKVPQCPSSQVYTVIKRNVLNVPLLATYSDGDDQGITRVVTKIEGVDPADFVFTDDSLDTPLAVGDETSFFYYRSENKFGNNLHTVSYEIYNDYFTKDDPDVTIVTCSVRINVLPANDPPSYHGKTEFVINEDEEWVFKFDEDSVDYEVDNSTDRKNRLIVEVESVERLRNVDETVGTKVYNELQSCTDVSCQPADGQVYDNKLPTFTFAPLANDYDSKDYVVVNFAISDSAQTNRNTTSVQYILKVNPVNDPPTIEVLGDILNKMNRIEKGNDFVFSWVVKDIDTLPRNLLTSVTATAKTRLPWEAYACSDGEDVCSTQLELSPSDRITFTVTADSDCPSQTVLKEKRGDLSKLVKCSATFTLRFVPEGSQTPYIQFSLKGFDGEDFSETKQILVGVTPVNLPPTVWSPPEITSSTRLVNIKNESNTVNTTDDAPSLWPVKFFMGIYDEDVQGHFVLPTSAIEKCDVAENNSVTCQDNIISINNWVKELRFNITDDHDNVTLFFFVDDQGFPGLGSDGLVSNFSYTEIKIDDSIGPAPPKSSSKLLIIALTVGSAGAIAVGVVVALLRNKLSPPTDDYFQIGTDTVSTSPESPLYVGQTKEGFSGLYSGEVKA